jgi:hypothetical protein
VQRELRGGTLCRGRVLTAGGRVVWLGTRGDHPAALSMPLTLAGRPRALGRADTVAADGDALLLGRWAPRGHGFQVSLRPLGAAGARSAAGVPRNSMLEAVAGDVFVLDRDRDLVLWRGGRAVRSVRDGWLLASDRSRVTWCRGGCRALTVWEAGRERTFAAPGSLIGNIGRAALSPDGLHLAAVVAAGGRPRVGVLDLTTGRWRLLRDQRVTGYQALAWSPSGAWLYFTGRRGRLMAWNEGRGARRLPVRTHGQVMTIATAPRTR